MRKNILRLIACFCMVASLLAGCSKQETGQGAMGSEVWEEMPKLTYGVLESDPLEVLPWNSGRLEATSLNKLAETELGYYFLSVGYLHYADKGNLNNWILVCNRPDCEHWDGKVMCNAKLGTLSFVIQDDRIIFSDFSSEVYPQHVGGCILISMAADGTDKRLAYAIEELANVDVHCSDVLTDQHWLYFTEYLDKDGHTVRKLYRLSEEGMQEFSYQGDDERNFGVGSFVYGDDAFICELLSKSGSSFFRVENGELIESDFSGLVVKGGYVSGDLIRVFRPDDGYYDVNLTTREEAFVAPAQLESSLAAIVLPNCIIESTLFYDSGREADEEPQMRLFDGKTWRTVKLPEELSDPEKFCWQSTVKVASDCIFFNVHKDTKFVDVQLYRIPLTDGELAAEYCSDIKMPTKENTKAAQ